MALPRTGAAVNTQSLVWSYTHSLIIRIGGYMPTLDSIPAKADVNQATTLLHFSHRLQAGLESTHIMNCLPELLFI